jgi:hypothetical protein
MSNWHIKGIILFSILFTVLSAKPQTAKFDIESGVVLYSISGGGALTKETNLSIDGSGQLRFREWGDIMLTEEGGRVITTGAIKHLQEIKRLQKQTHEKIINVDYENEQILERKKGKVVPNELEETKGLVQKGEEEVAGHTCKVWIGPGIKKCIYKGVVLKHESHVLGVSYIKTATQTLFDINVSQEQCIVPSYPVHQFGLFKDNIKTKNSAKVDNFCKILKDTDYDLDKDTLTFTTVNLEDKERQKFINYIGQDIFKKQKELLPSLLEALKNTRACLQTGDNPFEANLCLEEFSRLKEQLGTAEDDYIILWDEQLKNELLDKIEDEVIYVQSRIPCVNRAKNITDLSSCLK